MSDQDGRQHMLECEARDWLRRGYTSAERVEDLKGMLIKRRGDAAVDRLIGEMRAQWARRSEWLGGANG